LGDGKVVAMAVKELSPFVWRTFAEGCVALSEEGAVATQIFTDERLAVGAAASLTTTGVELTEDKHYWEVVLLSASVGGIVAFNCYLFWSYIIGVRNLHRHQQAQP
jgi:hypothetical protein